MAARVTMVEHEVNFDVRDLGPVLDMMRYESDRVVDWNRLTQGEGRDERYSVRLRCEETAYVPDRWSSFLLRSTLKSQY